jgi:hypothetical protein
LTGSKSPFQHNPGYYAYTFPHKKLIISPSCHYEELPPKNIFAKKIGVLSKLFNKPGV